MKRFACQRLYLSPDTYFIRYVVELGNNGKIQSYYPLEEEIYATQWIGGVIVLSREENSNRLCQKRISKPSLLKLPGQIPKFRNAMHGILPILILSEKNCSSKPYYPTLAPIFF